MEPKTTSNKTTGGESNVTSNKPETSGSGSAATPRTTPSTGTTPSTTTSSSSTTPSNPPSGSSPSSTSTPGSPNYSAGAATQAGRDRQSEISAAYRDAESRVSDTMSQASQAASDAWNRASSTVSDTYEHTLDYGRDNPGRVILIAFGVGVAVGVLLSNTAPSRSRGQRIVPPVMNALSEIARELFD